MYLPFQDRTEAGRLLAAALSRYAPQPNILVLALPRGGVPVAFEIAKTLDAELDIMLVRKLGVPGQEELAMGAIASGGVRVLNRETIADLNISDNAIKLVEEKEAQELERREKAYRGNRAAIEVHEQTVILVDDGLATGATMRAAITALRQRRPARIIVATPVAPADTIQMLREVADEIVCMETPEPFLAIGRWYEDFSQVPDATVKDLLTKAWLNKT